MFENLFRNAADHAGDDVTVWVGPLVGDGAAESDSANERGEGRVKFYVADDGPGMSCRQTTMFSRSTPSQAVHVLCSVYRCRYGRQRRYNSMLKQDLAHDSDDDGTKPVSPFHSW